MDPLIETPLRLASTCKPKSVSILEARNIIDSFIDDFKHRASNDPSDASNPQELPNSGGVLMSQLIRLRNGFDTSA